MPFVAIFGGLFGLVGEGVKALFGFKQEQAEVVKSAIEVLGQTQASNAQREQAIASIIVAENSNGFALSALWRPLTMMVFLLMLIMFWFGYVPSNITGTMPPAIDRIFGLIEIGLYGYIPARTIEKIVGQLNVGRVLQTLINKNIV